MVALSFALSLGAATLVSTAGVSATVRAPLTITRTDSPASTVLLAEQTGVIVDRFVLRAGREGLRVDTLSFQNCVTDGVKDYDGDCADDSETAGTDTAVAQIALLYNDGTYDRKTRGTLADGVVTFENLALTLPAGVDVPVALRITTGAIDDTTPSGATFQMNLNAITLPFHARTTRRGTEVTETSVNKNVVGTTHMLRQTLAALTLSSTAPALHVDDAWSEVFRFDVAATSGGDVTLKALTFTFDVTATDQGTWNTCPFLGASDANVALVNTATGAAVPGTWTMYDEDGVSCTDNTSPVGFFHVAFTDPEAVLADTTATYALYVDATYANAALHDTVRVSIPAEDNDNLPDDVQAIVWNDGMSTTDIDGTEVPGLPVVGNLLTF